ncbi:MAG: patatin-like phospholipase family protein [Chloroflexota bacterium]|nr:patatin-like phospholipase family protein [Chloroflexota bacterium]
MESPTTDTPVELIPADAPERGPERGIALCLSGGGYRAMLFHLGALWRLNELGYLPRLDRVSSVSGGSIAAGVLGLAWPKLDFDGGVGRGFSEAVAAPIRALAGETIDLSAVLRGLLGPGSANDRVVRAYKHHLYGDHTLQDLPDRPRFVINATNLQSGVLWRFSKPYMWDYRVGKIADPRVELAVAVAASSAFPPVLSPAVLEFEESDYTPNTGTDLQRPPFTTAVFLADGGVYDNLGLETAWKRYTTILVSDGGGHLAPQEEPARDWPRHGLRVSELLDRQVRALRKRQVIASYKLPSDQRDHRDGAYWGIRSDITHFGLNDALPCPVAQTIVLAETPTRLSELDARDQARLINWGYAICDAGMRAHVEKGLPPPPGFPYSDARVG